MLGYVAFVPGLSNECRGGSQESGFCNVSQLAPKMGSLGEDGEERVCLTGAGNEQSPGGMNRLVRVRRGQEAH